MTGSGTPRRISRIERMKSPQQVDDDRPPPRLGGAGWPRPDAEAPTERRAAKPVPQALGFSYSAPDGGALPVRARCQASMRSLAGANRSTPMRLTLIAVAATACLALGACSNKTQNDAAAAGDHAAAAADKAGDATVSAAQDAAANTSAAVNTAASETSAAAAKAGRKADAAADAAARQK
jgi:hypothetical protein